MNSARSWLIGVVILLVTAARVDANPWLFISDIHLKASTSQSEPSTFGDDTDRPLFQTAVREMQRIDPDPPVVVITGDLLGHFIDKRFAVPTTILIAKRLNAAFPHAQFILTLGNNDGACGDYGLTPDSPSLRAIAAAWAPLVNRRGAAPDFLKTFSHDGFYRARLPGRNVHALVVDDVYWSPRYHSGCGPATGIGARAMNELDQALKKAPGPVWVFFHIPPGIDAYSTAQIAHRLAVVPFLNPGERDMFLGMLGRLPGQVALTVAGHTHKFAYRIIDSGGKHPVPMLLVPAISPIFRNAPAFLIGEVTPDGILRDISETAYIDRHWQHIGSMRDLGVEAFTGTQLVALHGRLGRDVIARAKFEKMYGGGAPSEINDRNWSVYWCAATAFGTAPFRACAGGGGLSLLTERGIKAATLAVAAVIMVLGVIVVLLLRRRRRT